MSTAGRFEDGDKRIEWYLETPAWTAGDFFQLKNLVTAEFSFDRISGTVDFKVDYRPDEDACWHLWNEFQICSARNSAEDVNNPITYPLIPFCDGFRTSLKMPKPQLKCQSQSGRPMDQGYQFQLRLRIHGYCRVRAIRLYFTEVELSLYDNMACAPIPTTI